MKGSWSLRELLFWAKKGDLELREPQIEDPLAWRWSEDVSTLPDVLFELGSLIATHDREIYEKILLSCFMGCLLNKSNQTFSIAEYIFTNYLGFQDYLGLKLDELWNVNYSKASWIGITDNDRVDGLIGQVIVGLSESELLSAPITPFWWTTMADEAAQKALSHVTDIIRNRLHRHISLVWLFPKRAIHGGSFSLSVYAAAWSISSGKKLHGKIVLSGEIRNNGEMITTQHIKKKRKVAVREGFLGLICGSNGNKTGINNHSGLEIISICNLDELECFLELYEPGNVRKIWDFHDILKSPEALAARLHHLDEKTLRSPYFQAAYKKLTNKVFQNPDIAEEFAVSFEKAYQRLENNPALINKLLAPITNNHVSNLAKEKPHAAWTIAMCRSTCAAHEGDLAESKKWEALAKMATEKIVHDFGAIERQADLWNRHVVNNCHLAFRFRPELPQPFMSIAQTLEHIAKELSLGVAPVLGRLYGTAAQHFGFCGPKHLSQVEEYVRKAQRAFGDGKIDELRQDWNRQYNYLIYAYLDAGRHDEAEKALCSYLNVSNLSEIGNITDRPWNPYQHAALARFAADTGKCRELFDRTMIDMAKSMISPQHPWELWALNVGRIMQNGESKLVMWNISMEIAGRLKGPARALTLLPLAAMCLEGMKSSEEIASELERLRVHLELFPWLKEEHFGLLWSDEPPVTVLEKLWNDRHRFFPFTYR